MCKGVESWAWYGLQPINELTKPGGTLLCHLPAAARRAAGGHPPQGNPLQLVCRNRHSSFSGLWVYKDDHTDARVLGALCKVAPDLVSLEAMLETIEEQMGGGTKIASAQRSYDRTAMRPVEPGEGGNQREMKFTMPGWKTMEEGLVIRSLPEGGEFAEGEGGYVPGRSDVFKKFSTRSMRPVVNFETCIKCTLCWLQCPDTCFDVTPDGLYDANMEALLRLRRLRGRLPGSPTALPWSARLSSTTTTAVAVVAEGQGRLQQVDD